MEDVKDKIWWKIRRWWKFEARYTYKYTKEGIKNLIRWFPIIWKDRDWDTHYIWEIFKFKLQNQAKYVGDRDRHMTSKRDAEIMRLCAKLMDRIQNEYYSSEYANYQKSDFGFIPISGTDRYEVKSKILSEKYEEYFAKYPRIYKQVMEMNKSPFKKNTKTGIAINIAHINHNRARKLLFRIMEENIEKWWD